jgi:parvulin-like peptidyl-prolyl isomerase
MIAYFGGSGPMGSPNARAERMQDAIATVNGEAITRGDFENEWSEMKRFFGSNDANAAMFQGNTLYRMINAALSISLAKQKGLSVSDADIDKAIAEQKKDRSGKAVPESDWQKMLEFKGVTEAELRDSLRTSLLPAALFETFKSQVKATDQDLLATYDQVKARRIVINKLPEAPAKAKLQKIVEEIKKGADFAAMAMEKSTDSATRFNGGDMGYFATDVMPEAYAKALKSAKRGQLIGPVAVDDGYALLKVEDRRLEPPLTFEAARPQIVRFLTYDQIREQLEKLRARSKITKLVKDAEAGPPPADAPKFGPAAPAASTSANGQAGVKR